MVKSSLISLYSETTFHLSGCCHQGVQCEYTIINQPFKVAREMEKIPPSKTAHDKLTARVCHFDVESGTFKGKFGTLMWPSGTLMLPFNRYIYFLLRSHLGHV